MSSALPWVAQAVIALPSAAALVAAIRSNRTAKAENRRLLSEADLNDATITKTNAEALVATSQGVRALMESWRAELKTRDETIEKRDLTIERQDQDLGALRRARDTERVEHEQRIAALERQLRDHDIPLP